MSNTNDILDQNPESVPDRAKRTPIPLPGGTAAQIEEGKLYQIKVHYTENGKVFEGYLRPWGANAATMYWDCVTLDSAYGGYPIKFRPKSTGRGSWYLECDDGYWLSLRNGWTYRSFEVNAIGWQILDGKIYNDFWGGPLCEDLKGPFPEGRFTGQDLPVILHDCSFELVTS
ncbi:hypothetical protein [Undibacterium sp.]|jgi:hypothetical protein|uniref:hypothetical protein n=1 Tax=Undibacterium sp. TaxID=1914977 RepID=UPI002BF0EF35|nr:hypothetical protein [Undibacterium sp.]HTD05303.1 hypothetical protein [Undibacterium sp.]